MFRSTLIDFNPTELKNYAFMTSLDKYSETCNVSSLKNTCSGKIKREKCLST